MKSHVVRHSSLSLKKSGPHASASNTKAAQSIAVIVLLFVISWMPLYTFNTVICLCPQCPLPDHITIKAFIVLSHCNSIWNPLLYAWGMRDFKHCFWRLFGVNKSHVVIVGGGSLNKYRWQTREPRRTPIQSIAAAAATADKVENNKL